MWEDILKIIISNGIFATLFVGLLIYLLKDSSKREDRYTNTIKTLNTNLEIVDDIDNKIDDVKDNIEDIKDVVNDNRDKINSVSETGNQINSKVCKTNETINQLGENLKSHSKIIKRVSADVKVVKKDVKEIKKIVFPNEEVKWKKNLKVIVFGLDYQEL